MTLDNVVERISEGGNLLANLALLSDINTWQTAPEVFRAWQEGAPVLGVNTANLAVYRMVDGEAVFDLLGKTGNPFRDDRFREDAYQGIVGNEFFIPSGELKDSILSAIRAGESTTIRYSEIHLQMRGCSGRYGYIKAGSENTAEEKKLFSAVYGTDNPGYGKKISLLREHIVRSQLEGRPEDIVVWACFLNDAQIFFTYDRNINYQSSAVLGVRRGDVGETPTAEAVSSALSGMNAVSCYDYLLAHSEEALAGLDDTRTAGLSSLLAEYHHLKGK